MVSKKVIVKNRMGLHARVVTLLVKKASAFKCDILIEFKGKKADCKSIINILSLGVNHGAEVEVTAFGPDETLALEEVSAVMQIDD